jgi:hypothetical protein
MKKFVLIIIAAIAVFVSCNDYETYGDMKEKERNAINKFIADSSITVISEDVFVQNGYKTDLSRNEFVKLDKSGVYMQIVRLGCGEKLKDGETVNIVCRYVEFDILNEAYTSSNNTTYLSPIPDVMRITRTSGTFSAIFTKSASLTFGSKTYGNMYYTYSSATVPAGWLVPFNYIKIGIPQSETDEVAKVRLIVPHSQGHTSASGNVTPFFYEIIFQREA